MKSIVVRKAGAVRLTGAMSPLYAGGCGGPGGGGTIRVLP